MNLFENMKNIKLLFGESDYSGMGIEQFFFAAGWNYPPLHLQGFPHRSGGRGRTQFCEEGRNPTEGWVQHFGHEWGEPSPVPPLAANPDLPHNEPPEECAWSDYCNNFKKSDRVTNLQHVR